MTAGTRAAEVLAAINEYVDTFEGQRREGAASLAAFVKVLLRALPDDREGATVTAEQAWDEAAEATAEWMASYWQGINGPPDPPRNPYAVTQGGGDSASPQHQHDQAGDQEQGQQVHRGQDQPLGPLRTPDHRVHGADPMTATGGDES